MRKYVFIIFIMTIFIGSVNSKGQSLPFTSGQKSEVGAKAMSMGGAYTGIADDNSALYYNPAGLGQIQQTTVFGNFSHIMSNDRATFMGSETLEELSFTKLNAVGISLPLPTYRGSLVLAFGYHRVRAFDGALSVSKDVFVPVIFDSANVREFEVTQGYEETQEGGLNQTSFGASMEVAPDVFLGGALNLWTGNKDYSWRFSEIGGLYDVPNLYEEGDLYEIMRPDVIQNTHYLEKYTGINFTVGALFKATDLLHIGGVIITPVTITAKRDWDYLERETVYEGYEEFQQPDSIRSGYIDYKIRYPWIFRIGGAVNVGPLMISGDVELNDYSQMKYKTDPPEGQIGNMAEANREIRRNFRSVINYGVGGQFTLPNIGASIRAGYAVDKSPFKNALSAQNREIISFGAGISLSEQLFFDLSFAATSWDGIPDEIIEKEKIEVKKVLATLIYRM